MQDSLGDRMKSYEQAWRQILPPRLPILVRLDGRAFHSLTRKMEKPFDKEMTAAMDGVTIELAEHTQGCILAYTQSDEISLLLQQDGTINTQAAFGGVLQKITTLLASQASVLFNEQMETMSPLGRRFDPLPTFDARAWVMPWDDVPNYFLWRYKDWRRNSVNMLGRAHFSHKEMAGKSVDDILLMLSAKGVYWDEFEYRDQYGYFYSPYKESWVASLNIGNVNYGTIQENLDIIRKASSE